MSSATAMVMRNTRVRREAPRATRASAPRAKRDVGGHRDAPAVGARSAVHDREVDECGDGHATGSGGDWSDGPAPRTQLADGDLATDLEADEDEERHHRRVVDPVPQRQVEAEGGRDRWHPHPHRCIRRCRPVGPDQRDHGRGGQTRARPRDRPDPATSPTARPSEPADRYRSRRCASGQPGRCRRPGFPAPHRDRTRAVPSCSGGRPRPSRVCL